MYLGVEVKKRIKQMSYERLDRKKRRPAKLSEKTHPLKALSSVAHFLRNGAFILINDMLPHAAVPISSLRHR